jgi:ClpP class serine protease
MSPIELPEYTPLFYAQEKGRYFRHEFIRKIEAETKRSLIVYFADVRHPNGSIDRDDIAPFGDLLQKAGPDLDLLIHSPGGDIDAAEKIVYMCRSNTKSFRVIVPEYAKSAATLIALAADIILMGYASELGPIDPQIVITTPEGRSVQRPARSFLDGLEDIKKKVKEDGELSPVYYPPLSQLDPALLDYCNKAIKRSREFAVKWLKEHMLRDSPDKAEKIADRLLDVNTYLLHGIVIDHTEAEKIGLAVEFLPADNALWKAIWYLYCIYQADIKATRGETAKFFESGSVSIRS